MSEPIITDLPSPWDACRSVCVDLASGEQVIVSESSDKTAWIFGEDGGDESWVACITDVQLRALNAALTHWNPSPDPRAEDGRQVGGDGPAGGGAADGAGEGEAGRAAEGGAEAGLTAADPVAKARAEVKVSRRAAMHATGHAEKLREEWEAAINAERAAEEDWKAKVRVLASALGEPEPDLSDHDPWDDELFPEPPSPGAAGVGGGAA